MWPFDEEEIQDDYVAEFASVARGIYEESPDSDTGLGALRDVYSEYDFKDREKANELFTDYSQQIRERFQVRNKFDMDSTFESAPIDFSEVAGVGDTDDDKAIDQINKWEDSNLKALKEVTDPYYLQNRDFITSNVKTAARLKRRDIYSKDDTSYLTDYSIRAADGAVGSIADLFGADSVSGWLEENTDKDYDENIGAALASGSGTLLGVLATSAIPGGSLTYLAATGAGEVRSRYEQAVDSGADTTSVLESTATEASSQIIQTYAGEKVFGAAAKKILGKYTGELDSKVFSRIAKAVGLESSTEAVGQVISNQAENVATDEDLSLSRGVGKAALVAGILSFGASSTGESAAKIRQGIQEFKSTLDVGADGFTLPYNAEGFLDIEEGSPTDNIDQSFLKQIQAKEELDREVALVEGLPPPPREAVETPAESVTLENPEVIAEREDGTKIYKNNGVIHQGVYDKIGEAKDSLFFVSPEIAETLRGNGTDNPGLLNIKNPDGTKINTYVEDGDLYVESDFLNEDLTISKTKTDIGRKKIETSKESTAGMYDIGVSQIVSADGVRTVEQPIIGSAPIKSTAGAADITSLKTKESKYLERLRAAITEEQAVNYGLGDYRNIQQEDGSVTKGDFYEIPMAKFFAPTDKVGSDTAAKFIAEKNPLGTLDYLESLGDKTSVQDRYISTLLVAQLRNAQFNANAQGDYKSADAYTTLINEAVRQESKIASIAGATLRIGNDKVQSSIGGNALTAESKLIEIQGALRKQAEVEVAREIGVKKTSLNDLNKESKKASEEVEILTTEISSPVDAAIAQDLAELQQIDEKIDARDFDEPIKEFEKEANRIDGLIEDAKEDVKNTISEVDSQTKDAIDNTAKELKDLEEVVKKETASPLEPTKAQLQKEKSLNDRINKLRDREAKARKAANEPAPKKGTDKQFENYEKRVAKAKEEAADISEQINKTNNDKAALEEEMKERKTQPRQPSAEQVKKIDALKNKLTNLNKQFENVKTMDPAKSNAVKDLRSKKAQRLNEIRKLKKAKKAPRNLTPRQAKLKERIATTQAGKESGAFVSKQQRQRLVNALKRQTVAKERVSKAEQKFQEKMNQFPIEEQNRLRELYGIINDTKEPTEALLLSQEITNIQSKYLPITPETVDAVWNEWRSNVLSGVDTAARNFMGNAMLPVSTYLSYQATDLAKAFVGKHQMDAKYYLKGLKEGAKRGILEAEEVQRGNRAGKLSMTESSRLEENERRKSKGKDPITNKVQEYRWNPMQKVGPVTIPNPFIYLKNITTFMMRNMGAADGLAFYTNKEGQAYMAAHMIIEKNTPVEERFDALQKALYNTPEQQVVLRENVETRVAALKSAGIEVSKNQKELMFYEAMENNRAEFINKASERNALTNTYMNPTHNSFFGLTAKAIGTMTSWELPLGGKYILRPLKMIVPFANTAANIADTMLAHTPLGVGHLWEIDRRRGAEIKSNKEALEKVIDNPMSTDEDIKKAKEKYDGPDTYALEAREQMGRMMVGTTMMVVVAGILNHFADDDDPYISFKGLDKPGEYDRLRPEFSLKWGDTIITKEMLGPVLLAFVGADIINKAIVNKQDMQKTAYNVITGMSGSISKMSMLETLGNFFEMFQGKQPLDENIGNKTLSRLENFGYSEAAGYLQPLIPASGALRNIYKWYDGSATETYNNFQAKLLDNIPFGRDVSGAELKLNRFGEPIRQDLLNRSPVGLFVMSMKENAVSTWMQKTGYKLTDQGPTIQLNKTEQTDFPDRKDAYGKYKDILDEKESYEVLKIAGPRIKSYLKEVMADGRFRVYDEGNQSVINKEVNRIRAEARHRVLNKGNR